ncbi:YtfJ family protein [Gallaecimonas sp. GXIMD4217]|uniref:YtfJ family protein n=1 Tax=Gallaecimonas sp. GXIMD4217 TaxID=3131927 RepID=UPI00311B3700
MKYALLLALVSAPLLAHDIELGQPLPAVTVTDGGALVLEGDKLSTRPFQSSELTGKVRLLQHFAGRASAKAINEPMIDAIKAAALPAEHYQTVTVINVDDALWGTSGMVRGKAEDSKQEFPHSEIVLDEEGVVKAGWALAPKSSAILVLDAAGKVRFVKDGQLSDQEVTQVLALLGQLINEKRQG